MTDFVQYERQVIDWVSEWSRRDWRDLTPDTSINRGFSGLGVDGDDARELIDFLRKASGVSFENFDSEKFFGPEISIAAAIFRPLTFVRGLKAPNLTIRHLASFMYDNRLKSE